MPRKIRIKPILYLNSPKEYIAEDLHIKLCEHFVVNLIPESADPMMICPFSGDKVIGREAIMIRINKYIKDSTFYKLREDLYIINLPDTEENEEFNERIKQKLFKLQYNHPIYIFNDYTSSHYIHDCRTDIKKSGKEELEEAIDDMLELSDLLSECVNEKMERYNM